MNEMGLAFYIAAALISASCIIYTFIQNRTDKLQKKFYLLMLIIILLNAVSEAIVEILAPINMDTSLKFNIIYLCKYFYFIIHTTLLPLLGYYVLNVTGELYKFNKNRNIIFLIPIVFIEILLITNPIHKWCFSYDLNTLAYTRSWGILVLYVISALYIMFFTELLFSSWKAMTTKRRIALAYFLAVVITGIIIQAIDIKIRVELFSESLAYLGLLLTVEDEADLLNNDVGIYNRKGLKIDLDNLFANKREFHIICIKVENADIVRRVTGLADSTILSKMIYKELVNYIPRYHIYQTAPDTFALLLANSNSDDALAFAKRLEKRFENVVTADRIEVVLNAVIILACLPKDIDNREDVFNMLDSSLPRGHAKLLAGGADLNYLLRRKAIERALQKGLSEGNFEVYYQPTYNVKEAKINGAEALIQLHDKKIGHLRTEEFIQVAEQIGLISDIDDFVLRSVCEFIASGTPKALGIESINVNLSVLQCTMFTSIVNIIRIVDEYKVDHSMINFEITESINSNEYENVKLMVSQLRMHGFRVYMDDFGTGYSNVHTLSALDYNVIKIDKSILWEAVKSELGMIILENNIRMLKQLNLQILVEGVEEKEQVELLEKLDVDYLQGYFFAKPLSKENLVKHFSK